MHSEVFNVNDRLTVGFYMADNGVITTFELLNETTQITKPLSTE